VSSHFLNLSIIDPQEFGVERKREQAEQERVEREREEQERAEQERAEQERKREEQERKREEQERAKQEREDQEFLFRRLKPVDTSYQRDLLCMDGTRESILNRIVDWVANKSGQENVLRNNTYWFYGSPGIGKTSLAHSICEKLHKQQHLAGAFFCRRDDPNLNKPTNILPTFIHQLAIIFSPFRTIVAKCLRDDPHLTPGSMQGSLFLDFIRSLPSHPEHTLVFVIDALDECGDAQNRPGLMKDLTDAAAQAPWLKVIITSRTEVDIQLHFDTLPQASYLRYDLVTDQDASADLRTFAQKQFGLLATFWYLPTSWPEESDLNRVISRAGGLFIFIKTLVLALRHCEDPKESLNAALQDSAGTGLESLYELYSSILTAKIVDNSAKFQRMIGVLLTAAPYRALCDETIAELAGVEPYLVKRWVDALSSLLYRDEAANRGVRVWHLSIYDFFVNARCGYQVNVRYADVQLGIACLKTMVAQLRFNICKLEDSRLANTNIKELPSRVKENISDALQYSCFHWSNHLCSPPDDRNQLVLVLGRLKEFFEGLYPLFWIEVLSIMEMVPIGAPSLRRLISWVRVSTSPACC
jgi:DNA polymerase III delta prime subunit